MRVAALAAMCEEVASYRQRLETAQLFVATLTGKTLTVQISVAESTVYFVKLQVFQSEGIPPHMQRIIFGGRQLEDSKLLSEYRIGHENTVHLVLRLQERREPSPLQTARPFKNNNPRQHYGLCLPLPSG